MNRKTSLSKAAEKWAVAAALYWSMWVMRQWRQVVKKGKKEWRSILWDESVDRQEGYGFMEEKDGSVNGFHFTREDCW